MERDFQYSTCDKIFLVTAKEGSAKTNIKEGILVLTASDIATGRRYIHGLSAITVSRAQ